MVTNVTRHDVVHAKAHVVALLNQVDAVLTGFVLRHDRQTVEALTKPLYDLCDTDAPAKKKKERS